jgi:hypothetical protein
MKLTRNYLEKLGVNQLSELSKFVVAENFKHHLNNNLPKDYKRDISSIYDEEISYFNDSEIYVVKDFKGNILGSIRVLKWNYLAVLPLEKIFGIPPLLVTKKFNANNIYHIGRFAIKKEVRDINLFKQLMVCAIAPVCKHKENIAFAECDSKLLRILTLLGIKTTVIGESINYLGSETIPISMNYSGLINFYTKNKRLVSKESGNNQLKSPFTTSKKIVINI